MQDRRRRRSFALVLPLAVLLAGCTAAGAPAPSRPARTATAVAPSPRATGTPTPTPTPGTACAAATSDAATVAYADLPSAPDFTSILRGAGARVVDLAAGTYALSDFHRADGTLDAGVVGPDAAGLVGAGAAVTEIEPVKRSSTHAGDIPKTFPATNQLSVLRVTGYTKVLRDFGIRGTKQGHLYNGLRISKSSGTQVHDVKVTSVPGNDDIPPGETFGINDFHTDDTRYSHIEVDGAGVGASGFAANGSRDLIACDVVSHDNPAAMGFAFWQVQDIRLVDCVAERNGHAGFNFERVSGTVRLVRPVSLDNGTMMSIASDRGSADYTIKDPQLVDGVWAVRLPRTYYGSKNLQKTSDVHLEIGGKERDDLLRFTH